MAAGSFNAMAQTEVSMGGYTAMEIEAGRMKGNFATGAIEEMTDGVRIRLLSEDPELHPLPIRANSMKLTWTEGSTTPSTILMEKNVEVQHPDAAITADRAEWNFDSGELVFSGNPEVNSRQLKGLRGDKMILNLKTNTFEVMRVRAEQVPLQTPEEAERVPENALREQHITQWEKLIDAIKDQAQAEAPSPGKQILSLMSNQNQQLLLTLETAMLAERKSDILRLLNNILTAPGFYKEEAWAGLVLPEEAQALLAQPNLDSKQQTQLNRLLLETAYPFAFATQ
jgi:hypothetical protein